jgi:hypothetical protein
LIRNKLKNKKKNLKRLFDIYYGDIRRSFSWNVLGTKHIYNQAYHQLVKANRWCFIVGCNNSGTSLLQELLERTNKVSTFPFEGQRYTRVLKRSTKRGHERVWSEYLEELEVNPKISDKLRPRLLYDWMSELTMPVKEIIVEKTPANIIRMKWLNETFPKSYFIGIVRNGYAVAEGIRRKGHKPVDRGAKHWNFVNKRMIESSKDVDNFLLIKYEDLVDKQEKIISLLSIFLGIDLNYFKVAIAQKYEFETVLGAEATPIMNMNSKSIEALNAEDIETINHYAGEMLSYFNYELK